MTNRADLPERRDDAEPLSSAAQDDWKAIAEELRGQLSKAVKNMAGLAAADVLNLVNAIEQAIWLEVRASTYDAAVLERRRVLEREDI